MRAAPRSSGSFAILLALSCLVSKAGAQNRGVYPLGMSATNAGITPGAGFSYVNQLLFYSRDHARDDAGNTLPVGGENYVLMDLNTIVWVGKKEILGGARYSVAASLPVAKNSLTTDVSGHVSGGSGFADSYYMPFILGWNGERFSARAIYGFLAPTGRFEAGGNQNVGSGYWTHAFSSGQTFQFVSDKRLALSVFEMYEVHTHQETTDTHPGDTFDLDYSLLTSIRAFEDVPMQAGVVGYEARQTTARTGPGITETESGERYAVNAIGVAASAWFTAPKASLGFKYFWEFSNRSTYQGYSAQLSGSLKF
jgi:hypothetical protein